MYNVFRPPPVSAPTYIIEQSPAAVPSTSKSAYNVSKYEPYYNVYDDDQDVYHDTGSFYRNSFTYINLYLFYFFVILRSAFFL